MSSVDASGTSNPSPSLRWTRVAALLVLVTGILIVVGWWVVRGAARVDVDALVEQGRRSLERGDLGSARMSYVRALAASPRRPSARLLAGRVELRADRFEEALAHFALVPEQAGEMRTTALWNAGDALFLGLDRPFEAETSYRLALERDPNCLPALESLSALLGVTARSRAAIPIRLKLIERRRFDPLHLHLLCMGDTVLENLEQLARMRKAHPDDLLTMLGTARELEDRQREAEAIGLLEEIIRREPAIVEAHVRLGRLRLAESGERFAKWYAALPDDVRHPGGSHPDVWALLGDWCRERGRLQEAARCYWEAVRLDPQHERATHQLGQSLIALGEPSNAAPFLERAAALERYFSAVKVAWRGREVAAVREACEVAESLGMVWEAYGWAHLARERLGQPEWAIAAEQRIERQLPAEPSSRALPTANPALRVDLASWPLPTIVADTAPRVAAGANSPPNSPTGVPATGAARASFEDRAGVAGLDFTYFNGAEPDAQTRRMQEFNGGGVGVGDFDRDGWPDLYLTQGCRWPVNANDGEHHDRLYLNNGDGHFTDTTTPSIPTRNGFGAGVAVGDFNADGFPDLYVCNAGRNRLLENNGDGTFTDVTDVTGTAGDDWSASAALADLDGDGLADLYVVNYLAGEDVFVRVCPDRGVVRSCSPRHFAAATDRIHWNLGDGRFGERATETGVDRPLGKGLGVVVAELDGEPGLDVFVANDAVPNFLYANDGHGRFAERGLITGLATNGDGRPEACMGVAAGDGNGDGSLDLFVTNFHNETNSMYQQVGPGQFVDETLRSGLAEPSLKMLGFGTQFIDAELDGWPDLIVVNGHVDDLRDVGMEYAMRPQFHGNLGHGRFREVEGARLGEYFTRRHLGRGMAVIDWNRDGREDVAVTHLHSPVALLTNTTADPGRYVALRLVGVASNRDAIGAVVELHAGDRSWSRFLVAGDGFQASNERRLVFGLGDHDRADRVTVRWPSGHVQEVGPLDGNSEWTIVEGANEPISAVPTSAAP